MRFMHCCRTLVCSFIVVVSLLISNMLPVLASNPEGLGRVQASIEEATSFMRKQHSGTIIKISTTLKDGCQHYRFRILAHGKLKDVDYDACRYAIVPK